ncbi:MAG: queuosine precursor transporter [Wolbachia sp.]|nr:queuosine precursor transporter [Wolbachia sp.]MDD9336327.1 queuosine precursor transporter [Wolbachia sp.]
MNVNDKIYTFLCVLFAVLVITGNLIYQKFVSLSVLSIYTFELSVGAILYPLTFLLTDLIAEFYGKEKSGFCIKLAIVMNVIIVIVVALMDNLNATSWSKIDNKTFHMVFGKHSINFIASIIACYTAQLIDIRIYLWIRNVTNGNFLWLRNNCSTAISLLIDTTIVISILCMFGVLPTDHMLPIIISSYLFKLFFTICSTPLFYFGVWVIGKMQ